MAKKGKQNKSTPENMPIIHPHAAGIDVAAEEHWVCAPPERDAPTYPAIERLYL